LVKPYHLAPYFPRSENPHRPAPVVLRIGTFRVGRWPARAVFSVIVVGGPCPGPTRLDGQDRSQELCRAAGKCFAGDELLSCMVPRLVAVHLASEDAKLSFPGAGNHTWRGAERTIEAGDSKQRELPRDCPPWRPTTIDAAATAIRPSPAWLSLQPRRGAGSRECGASRH
jgi:hypothetical protein